MTREKPEEVNLPKAIQIVSALESASVAPLGYGWGLTADINLDSVEQDYQSRLYIATNGSAAEREKLAAEMAARLPAHYVLIDHDTPTKPVGTAHCSADKLGR